MEAEAEMNPRSHQIDQRHNWLFDKIAEYCQLGADVVEDQILDSDVSFGLVETFNDFIFSVIATFSAFCVPSLIC